MYEKAVSGEIKALGWRDGSSGIFTGSIEGQYEGYRLGSVIADEQSYTLELPHGNIAVSVRQQLNAFNPLPLRPAEHPFAQGRDPFAQRSAQAVGDNPLIETAARHFPQKGPASLAISAMDVCLIVDPSKSSGIFAGATGEVKLTTPAYRVGGRLVITTQSGELHCNFLEDGERDALKADLWVDGEKSTGLYQGAEGELRFNLTIMPPNFAQGPYEGILRLRQNMRNQ